MPDPLEAMLWGWRYPWTMNMKVLSILGGRIVQIAKQPYQMTLLLQAGWFFIQINWQQIQNRQCGYFQLPFLSAVKFSVFTCWNVNLVLDICWKAVFILVFSWQSSIYLTAVWKQFLCHSYTFSVWITECHRTAMACCSHGVQAPVATFGMNVTALLVQRDLHSIMRGWRIPLMALLLRIYFCTKSTLNEKLKSGSLPVWHALLYVNL